MQLELLACVLVSIGVPVTHVVGGRVLHRKSWSPRATFARGGRSFLAFQTLTWTFWALAILLALASASVAERRGRAAGHPVHTPTLSGAAVCGSVLAEVLMIASILTFQARPMPAPRALALTAPSRSLPRLARPPPR